MNTLLSPWRKPFGVVDIWSINCSKVVTLSSGLIWLEIRLASLIFDGVLGCDGVGDTCAMVSLDGLYVGTGVFETETRM